MCSMWTVVIIFERGAGTSNVLGVFAKLAVSVCVLAVCVSCVCVCVSRRSMLATRRRQKMRFADQWSLKHIYNGQKR